MTSLIEKKVLVTGHRGMVGSAIVRRLEQEDVGQVIVADRNEVDLRNQQQVDIWFSENRPDIVFHVAGTVGGIWANSTRPAEFLYDNIMMQANVIHASWKNAVEKLLYLGSSCIYPRDCPQPIREESLLTGSLEATNEAYALAKISGVKACEAYRKQYGCNFISAMPTNLYGVNDNFDLKNSHVLPALIRKFHHARQTNEQSVEIWGTGSAKREFLHVDDLADACIHLMQHYNSPETINVGTGKDLSIRELAELVASIVYPGAQLKFDLSKPDGTPRKCLNVDKLHSLGWSHKINLAEGIQQTYEWFLQTTDHLRGIEANG